MKCKPAYIAGFFCFKVFCLLTSAKKKNIYKQFNKLLYLYLFFFHYYQVI